VEGEGTRVRGQGSRVTPYPRLQRPSEFTTLIHEVDVGAAPVRQRPQPVQHPE